MGDIDDIYAGCSVKIDGYCLNNDVDDYDLYSEKMIGDNDTESDFCLSLLNVARWEVKLLLAMTTDDVIVRTISGIPVIDRVDYV